MQQAVTRRIERWLRRYSAGRVLNIGRRHARYRIALTSRFSRCHGL